MTTLSTHDTKRSADVRARLAALTTVPAAVSASWEAWWSAAGGGIVDPRDGWLVFHTLVGAHPLPVDRAWSAIEKSLREAKLRTSWTAVDDDYEAAVRSLVERAVREPELGRHTTALAEHVLDAGRAAALAQLLVQLLAPGVPDLYQGGEDWDLSLVDPDNRRPVDPSTRRADSPRSRLIRGALGVRRRRPLDGYEALPVSGLDADRVLAFARGDDVVVAAVRPGRGGRVDVDAVVALPDGRWRGVLDGTEAKGVLDLAEPVALLEREP